MNRLDRLRAEPWANDLLATLREFERSRPDAPRIGTAASLSEEIVEISQDPFLAFPASNVVGFEESQGHPPRLVERFLGFLGPQGVLPLTNTLEAYHWTRGGDDSFQRFLDLFLTRFVQLYFRAWGSGRPAVHRDRPAEDRFAAFVGAFSGIDGPGPDTDLAAVYGLLPFSGLLAPRVKSAARLARFLKSSFRAAVEVEERIGLWLEFEPEDRNSLGQRCATLGSDAMLGARVHSINDKFRVAVRAANLADYESLLPGGPEFERLNAAIFFYVGHRCDYEVELALPAEEAPAARLGRSGRLGWTAWTNPPPAAPGAVRRDARFAAAARARARSRPPSRGQEPR